MIRLVRKLLALLSAAGLGASVWFYVRSYSGASLEGMRLDVLGLQVGVFALILPMCAMEYSALKKSTFFWDDFARGKPKWVVPTIKLLGLFFFVHFVLFAIQSHLAGPGVKNGEYVLESHGRIVSAISRAEYVKLKGAELRIFVTGWMFFYFVPLVYWWFPRTPRRARDNAAAASSMSS